MDVNAYLNMYLAGMWRNVILPLGVVVVAFILGWNRGAEHIQSKWDAERAVAEAELAKWKLQATQAEAIASAAIAKRNEAVRAKTTALLKRARVYVPANTPDLPGSFRVLYDAAARGGKLPDSPDVSAPPTSAQDVAASIVENFGKYHEAEEYVRTLNEWAARQK